MIVHVEYRCPECEKVFNCPANLASHRRWHKPKVLPQPSSIVEQPIEESTCEGCGKRFRKMGAYRKHVQYCFNNNNNNNAKSPGKYSIAELLSTEKCQSCHVRFGSKAELDEHIRQNHTELTFPCRLCSQLFLNLFELTSHVANEHHQLNLQSSMAPILSKS
jgi:uncharacterized C2H2 Zn-finger protein